MVGIKIKNTNMVIDNSGIKDIMFIQLAKIKSYKKIYEESNTRGYSIRPNKYERIYRIAYRWAGNNINKGIEQL